MPSPAQHAFGDLLDELLAQRGLTLRAFARLVQAAPQTVSNAKRLSLNPEHFERWADALKLSGRRRQRFLDLAWETHAPPAVRERLRRLEAEVERLRES